MNLNEIIVVEDNKTMLLGMAESLRREDFGVFEFEDPEEAWRFFEEHPVPLVITDLKMEPMDGMNLMKKIKEISPSTETLMVSAYGTVEKAVEAMQIGAADFITKPFSPEELRIRVKKLMEKIRQSQTINRLQEENRLLHQDIDAPFENIIGDSAEMKQVFELVERVAEGTSSVLIQGESGTGKELIARAIHRKSPRANQPFIKVNCAALNENLLESELFGHEKGAFTGAVKLKRGRFELADGGTFFLDEIGDIPLTLQTRLLRVLQEREFERVGGETPINVDVRFVFATHQDLAKLMAEGQFREDLYYRLSVVPVNLPPLRQRREDIPILVKHFLATKRQTRNQEIRQIDNNGMKLLTEYDWPGNVRELENLIERLIVLTPDPIIEATLIEPQLGHGTNVRKSYDTLPLEKALSSFEKDMIEDALKRSNGIKSRAARLLGIKTSTLYYKIEKFGLMD